MKNPRVTAPKSRTALRREREKEQRAQSILRAAEMLFARDGYHGTGVEQIAEQAEVSVGTVYFYFKNKEDLLIKLLDEIAYDLRNLIGSGVKQGEFHLDAFKNAGHLFFRDFCLKNQGKVMILLRESVGQGPEVEEKRRIIFNRLIKDVQQALDRVQERMGYSWSSPLTTEILAASIVGMFERLTYQYLIWQDRSADLENIADEVVRFIGGGIGQLVEGQSSGGEE